MSSEIKKIKLKDILEITSSKRIFMSEYVDIGIPFYRSKEIIEKAKGGNISTELFITEDKFNDIEKKFGVPVNGDILLTSVGTIGIPYLIQQNDKFYFKDGNLTWFKNFSNKLYNKFMLYWLQSKDAQNKFDMITIGSTQKALTISSLKELEIPLPSLLTQKKIAHILSTLDDKIELNRKMNQTLEEMASAIFKSWFVDFDPVNAKANCEDEAELENIAKELGISKAILDLFPSEFIESELGMIPKGWEVKKAGDFTNTFDYVANGSFASLKENVTLYDEPNDILYVRTTDFNNGFKGSLKYTDKNSYDFLKKSKLLGHETIISNVADVGTIFRAPVWLGLPMTLGSNAIGVVGLDNEFLDSYIFYFFKSQIGQHLIESITTGSAQLKFNKTSFRALNILVPNIEIRNIFEKQEKLIYEKIVNNVAEIETLQKTRDTLLPKLLSGEIDVSELEIL